ncbi:hypothetical protein DEI83_13730 [Curtobacterium sp. MCBD17_021]|nr:hypothetical protein DEI83_13730 [Curtobacterium sp. MCBD17_021]
MGVLMLRFNDATRHPPDDSDLTGPFVNSLPVAAAAISTFGGIFGTALVAASGPSAATADEQQVALGEGPGWSALRNRSPVTVYDFATANAEDWPTALVMLQRTGWSGVLSFPLFTSSLDIGAVTLYLADTKPLSSAEITNATHLAGLTAQRILAGAVRDMDTGATPTAASVTHPSGRHVQQATGMVAAQLDVSVENALLIIHARAFANAQPLHTLAEAILDRRVDLCHDEDDQHRTG